MSTHLVLRSAVRRTLTSGRLIIPGQVRRAATDAPAVVVPGGRAYSLSHYPGFTTLTTATTLAIYEGTVNDPTPFPPPSRVHGSYHWAFERLLSAGLVPLTVAAFATSATQHPIIDGLLGVTLVVHSHIGFDSIIVDYLHKRKFPVIGRIMIWTLRTATVAALAGIYQFNTNDIGLTELIAKVWTV